ncbi:MAG: hypothetical protein ACK53Y_17175, partial [bacterium]
LAVSAISLTASRNTVKTSTIILTAYSSTLKPRNLLFRHSNGHNKLSHGLHKHSHCLFKHSHGLKIPDIAFMLKSPCLIFFFW